MRYEVQSYISRQPELQQFIRLHPYWYRRLAREPHSLEQMRREADVFYGRTFEHRIDRLQGNLQLAMMLMQMFQYNGSDEQHG